MALKASEIHATVQLAVQDRTVRATVVFHNTTKEKAYLYKRLVPGGERLKMDLFRITGPAGELRYRGFSVKLRAPTAADFLEIAPGATLEGTVNLADNYAFPPGAGSYRVRYLAANSTPQGDDLRKIESPEVPFEMPA